MKVNEKYLGRDISNNKAKHIKFDKVLHSAVIGCSGSGKTYFTTNTFISNEAINNPNYITNFLILNGKADPIYYERFNKMGIKYINIDIKNNNNAYKLVPFSVKNTEDTNLSIEFMKSLLTYESPFYQSITFALFEVIFNALRIVEHNKNKGLLYFDKLLKFFTPAELVGLQKEAKAIDKSFLDMKLTDEIKSVLIMTQARLYSVFSSSARNVFLASDDTEAKPFFFEQCFANNISIIVTFDSFSMPELSFTCGQIFLTLYLKYLGLKSNIRGPKLREYVLLDEITAYCRTTTSADNITAIDRIYDLLSRSRSFSVKVILITQSAIAELSSIHPNAPDRVMSNIDCLAVFRSNSNVDTSYIADYIGTMAQDFITYACESKSRTTKDYLLTGKASVKEELVHKIQGEQIRFLPKYHAVFICKNESTKASIIDLTA